MRAFVCKRCRELVAFESHRCGGCGIDLGYDPVSGALEALLPAAPGQGQDSALALVDDPTTPRWRRCQQAGLSACNWLVPWDAQEGPCLSCRLTSKLPPLKDREFREAFTKAEMAKRRLVYQLVQLKLPIVSRADEPAAGLSFELDARAGHAVTGHANGVITIDLNETDDAFRETTRAQFGEPYRTLLGHFRHEIGHYYWLALVLGTSQQAPRAPHRGRTQHWPSTTWLDEARSLFGDEGADYEQARRNHYDGAAKVDWRNSFVSAYAAMHPLEDWAETFAHYLHIWDAVQTAASFGVLVVGPVDDRTGRRDPAKASAPSEETAALEGFDAVIADWVPLTHALNALNRSLGKDDLYPFDLPPAVITKLAFVHRMITSAATATTA
ncbi:MAG TPA: putative zinc-binding metallopeptidase [Acidimicrobiales bacterium]|nr:putative zinc-binding metallopeptidase [Acidimicrobiales bacterium]